jgi:dTMP kinase
MPDSPRPMFVAFEGIDGCGKSTQIERLSRRLATAYGVEPVRVVAIGGTTFGARLREFSDAGLSPAQETLLLAAARLDAQKLIVDANRNGRHVLADRWSMSSHVYQTTSSFWSNDVETIERAAGVLRPDWYVYYKIDPEVAFRRVRSRRGGGCRFEKDVQEFERLSARYDDAFESLHARIAGGATPTRCTVLDGGLPEDELAELTWAHLKDLLSPKG